VGGGKLIYIHIYIYIYINTHLGTPEPTTRRYYTCTDGTGADVVLWVYL
jgi:hypothetical protein